MARLPPPSFGKCGYSQSKSGNDAGATARLSFMSPLFRLYTPSPFMLDFGNRAAAPFHQSESSLNSKLPVSAVTWAAGGRNANASMLSAAIVR